MSAFPRREGGKGVVCGGPQVMGLSMGRPAGPAGSVYTLVSTQRIFFLHFLFWMVMPDDGAPAGGNHDWGLCSTVDGNVAATLMAILIFMCMNLNKQFHGRFLEAERRGGVGGMAVPL